MASYLIVVPRGNSELLQLLSIAFRGRSGFTVIVDRRANGGAPDGVERRGQQRPPLGQDEIIVAEQAVRVGHESGPGRGPRRVVARTAPLVRGRIRRHRSDVERESRVSTPVRARR